MEVNGTSALTLVKNDDSLLTIEQMAVLEGITPDGMRKRLEKAGIKPVKEAQYVNNNGQNEAPKMSAVYDYLKIQEYFKGKRQSALTPQDRCDIVIEQLNALDTVERAKFAIQAFASVVSDLNKLQEQLARDNTNLKIELDEAKEWYSIKRVLKETGHEYDWRALKKYSLDNGYDMPKCFDKNYGEVNSYHIEVWNAVYGLEL